jgi:NADH:ubiquinone oxidoreductase subunit K
MKLSMKWSAAQRNTLILAGCGLLIVGLLAVTLRAIRLGYDKASVYRTVVITSQQLITESRLQFFLAAENNRLNDLDDKVVSGVVQVSRLLNSLYAGGRVDGVDLPEPDIEAKALLKNILYDAQHVATVIRQQKQAGTVNREEVEVAFEQLEQSLKKLNKLVADKGKVMEQHAQILSILSLIVPASMVVLGVGLYFRFYRNRQKLEENLRQSLEEETKRVQTLSAFIEAISNGDYTLTLESDDKTGLSGRLMTMRDKLKANAEEDARRNWATQGLARIGEILRDTTNSELLYDQLVKFVVTYTGSNQGGLFLLNDDDENNPFLDLVSAYAFERKKFITRRVDIGQGMVGQCYLEADRIFLAKLPEAYVHITSGLGGATPTCLLLVPLKANEKVYGVLELASFKKLEEHEIQLVEKFAASIAATVSTVRVNEKTRILLEHTQQQAEEMRAQEEEMRQNMEELSATQEEMARKEREYIKRIEELENQANTRIASR